MHHASLIDELAHYLGQLRIDILLGVERRHLLSTARLCGLLIERIDAADPRNLATLHRAEYKQLQIHLLDLQRAIAGNVAPKEIAKARPRLSLVPPVAE
jgi:hypothetical protein